MPCNENIKEEGKDNNVHMDLRRLRHRIIQNETHAGRRKPLARRFFNAEAHTQNTTPP